MKWLIALVIIITFWRILSCYLSRKREIREEIEREQEKAEYSRRRFGEIIAKTVMQAIELFPREEYLHFTYIISGQGPDKYRLWVRGKSTKSMPKLLIECSSLASRVDEKYAHKLEKGVKMFMPFDVKVVTGAPQPDPEKKYLHAWQDKD